MQALPLTEAAVPGARALIVGADRAARQALVRFLAEHQIDVWEGDGVERGLALARRRPVDVVLVCADVSGAEGGRFVREVRTFDERTAVVAVATSAEHGREALAAGAYDYFLEPVDLVRLDVVLRHLLEARGARERSELLAEQCAVPARLGRLVTHDPRVIAVFAAARRVARYETPILILGESGTGKESMARAMHEYGRPGTPFVPVDGETLMVDTLDRACTAARGGTLFVNDVHSVGPEVAAALVVALDRADGEMRVIAAAPAGGNRRSPGTPVEDLALRLHEVVLEMPPLAARPDDVVPIARELLREWAGGHEPPTLTRAAGEALRVHRWSGNVDELRTVLEVAHAAAGAQPIEVNHLPPPLGAEAPEAATPGSRKLADIEAVHLRQVLAETRGNKARAARILGVSRWALQRRLQKHRISAGESMS